MIVASRVEPGFDVLENPFGRYWRSVETLADAPVALAEAEDALLVATADEAAQASGHPKIDARDAGAMPDDLESLMGVGPRMAEKLHRLGIDQYAQLAALEPGEEAWLDLKLNARGRVMREGWVEEARARLDGRVTE